MVFFACWPRFFYLVVQIENVKSSYNKSSRKVGLPPGSLIHIGEKKSEKVKISLIDFNQDELNERVVDNVQDCFPFKETATVTWINVDGLHDIQVISELASYFGADQLVIEDILNTNHRPKVEEWDDYLFATIQMKGIAADLVTIVSEQVSFLLGKNWLISFQEKEGDLFQSIRINLRENKGNARKKGPDYLFYRLLDTIVDNYFFVSDFISETAEELEEQVLKGEKEGLLKEIQAQKRLLLTFKRTILPVREMMIQLQKDNMKWVKSGTVKYLKDVYEHVVNIIDVTDSQRETIYSVMDLYHSGVSNKMNEVMKVLTIISTIFIPLSFFAGVYGMNFDHIPELHWKYGYAALWVLMILVVVGQLWYFKRKKWL